MSTPTATADVAIVGDGPAAAALCRACVERGLDVVVIGRGEPWQHTYAAWIDDFVGAWSSPDVAAELEASISHRHRSVEVVGDRRQVIERDYGAFDNDRLRVWSRIDEHLKTGEVAAVFQRRGNAIVRCTDGNLVQARWAIDATGVPPASRPTAWQTAYGIFVDDDELVRIRRSQTRRLVDGGDTEPRQADDDLATLMDWSPVAGAPAVGVPTFCYIVRVGDRWLVEETVLASRSPVQPTTLRASLAARIGGGVVAAAERRGDVELVTIPMGLPPRRGAGPVAVFGTAAGMGHPATGYSVAASLRAAPHLATAFADGGDVHKVVWNASTRAVRSLHDYGLSVMLGLDADDTRRFFDAFFELPAAEWTAYLRGDSTVRSVSRAMRDLFTHLPWAMRRRLVAAGPAFGLERLRRVGRSPRPSFAGIDR